MAEPFSLQTLLTYLTLISVPVGVFYHIMTLRNTRKNQQLQLETRQAQLFMQIYSRWNSLELARQYDKVMRYEWTDFEDWEEKRNTDIEYLTAMEMVNHFFEGIGVLANRSLIDITLIDDLMSSATMRYWEKYRALYKEARVRWNRPQAVEWVEYLYNHIKTIVEEQHPELKT